MALPHDQWVNISSHNEKEYFKVLGSRIAHLRKELELTQVQLAEMLGISQQMVASYEVGRRRIPVSMLPSLAQALKVQTDALLGNETKPRSKRGPTPKWQLQIEAIAQLPKAKQRFVSQVLETVLAQASR
jgi:transcriptional regulator with XRE-family HTH domain